MDGGWASSNRTYCQGKGGAGKGQKPTNKENISFEYTTGSRGNCPALPGGKLAPTMGRDAHGMTKYKYRAQKNQQVQRKPLWLRTKKNQQPAEHAATLKKPPGSAPTISLGPKHLPKREEKREEKDECGVNKRKGSPVCKGVIVEKAG